MTALKALAVRAALTFFDTLIPLLIVGGVVKWDINVLEQAALAAGAAALGVVRNGLALVVPAVPSTLPPTVTTP